MNWIKPKTFAAKHKEQNIRMASRSGGIFTALTDLVLAENGVIYGCCLNENFEAIHIRTDSIEGRNKMRGSKYVQSVIGNTFCLAKKDLDEGKKVLFSGTPCQISGLKSFLGKDYDNLLCVDIVCHGVPSPLLWEKYLKWQGQKHGAVVKVDFRNKVDFGWADHVETLFIKTKNGKLKKVNSKVYTNLFYSHSFLRPCCYNCPYKSTIHPGDITLADYWGIEKAAPGFNDNKGVSLVLINNQKGLDYFNETKESIIYVETRIEDSMRPSLEKPFPEPENREIMWKLLWNSPFDILARNYGRYGIKYKVKDYLRNIKHKLLDK